MRAVAAALALLAVAAGARAQGFTLRGEGAAVWLRGDSAGASSVFRGPALGGEARMDVGPVLVGGELIEARLQSSSASAHHDLVEGAVFAGVRLWPWLELSAGPRIRAYVVDTRTERWVWVQGRARVAAPIVPPTLAGYVELWRSFASSNSAASSPGRVQGGEAGVVIAPLNTFSIRLAYRVDDAWPAASRRETVEALNLGLEWRP